MITPGADAMNHVRESADMMYHVRESQATPTIATVILGERLPDGLRTPAVMTMLNVLTRCFLKQGNPCIDAISLTKDKGKSLTLRKQLAVRLLQLEYLALKAWDTHADSLFEPVEISALAISRVAMVDKVIAKDISAWAFRLARDNGLDPEEEDAEVVPSERVQLSPTWVDPETVEERMIEEELLEGLFVCFVFDRVFV